MHLKEESRPIGEHIQQTKLKQVSTEEIKENQQDTQSIKWKKATNESIKGKEVISKSSERIPSLELKKKTFRRSGETGRSRNRNDTLDKAKNEISWNDRKNEVATIKGASKRRDRRSPITRNEDNNVTIDSTDDNDADDEEDESANLQTNEETEQPSDEEEIINLPVVRSSSKRPITPKNQMMTVMTEVKKGVVCVMKIGETDKSE